MLRKIMSSVEGLYLEGLYLEIAVLDPPVT